MIQSFRFWLGFIFLSLMFCSFSLLADEIGPPIREWSEVLTGDSLKIIDDVGSQVPNVIFDAISNISAGIYSNDHLSLDISVKRNVYNNREVHGTWTVIDNIGLGSTVPFLQSGAHTVNTPFPYFGFFIGSHQGVNFMNIRQVRPRDYLRLPSPEERRLQLEADNKFISYTDLNRRRSVLDNLNDFKGHWVQDINAVGDKIFSFLPADGENYARYSRVWNLALVPFKLPLNSDAFSQMDDGEILSYIGNGSIEFGINTGWELDFPGVAGLLEAGASLSTSIRGFYRISVLRENSHIARVKVTRSAGLAGEVDVGGDYKPGIFDGMFLISNINTLLKVVPFKLSYEQSRDFATDVVYRYDLSVPAARTAYENAVLGLFKESEDLALKLNKADDGNMTKDWRKDLNDTGVMRVLLRTTDTSYEALKTKMQLSFIFKMETDGSLTDVKTKITLPDGSHKYFSALAENTKDWSLIFGRYQKAQHNFSINLDLDQLDQMVASMKANTGALMGVNTFPLQIEGRIDDSNTSPRNLLGYILEVEDSLGVQDLFPRTVELTSLKNNPYDPLHVTDKIHDLGATHFYYQIKLSPEQVQKFIDFPDDQMTEHMEKAFHVKKGSWNGFWNTLGSALEFAPASAANFVLNLFQINIDAGSDLWHAWAIQRKWRALKTVVNAKDRAEALGSLFFDRIYSRTLISLLRDVLEGEEVNYYLNASNPAVGKIIKEGGTKLVYDDLASKLNGIVNFDGDGSRQNEVDKTSKIEDLKTKIVNEDQVELSFNLSKVPSRIYFDLSLDDIFLIAFRNKVISALIVDNKGQFHAGQNTLLLNPHDLESPLSDISRNLQRGGRYLLRMAISEDGKKWGEAEETKFRDEILPLQ